MSKNKNAKKQGHKPQHNTSPVVTEQKQTQTSPTHITVECKLKTDAQPEKKWSDMALHNKWLICLTLGTVLVGTAVVVIYGLQLMVMNKTLKADQRAWVKMSNVEFPHIAINETITTYMTVVNTGKTPARDIAMDLRIEFVPNGQSPQLDYQFPHTRDVVGVLYPNDTPLKVQIPMVDKDWKMIPANQEMVNAFTSGEGYFTIYGKIFYKTLGEIHWVQFCGWHGGPQGTYTAQECTRYNKTDDE